MIVRCKKCGNYFDIGSVFGVAKPKFCNDCLYKNRVQIFNPKTKQWVKLCTKTGRSISTKKDGLPYKNVEIYDEWKYKNNSLANSDE